MKPEPGVFLEYAPIKRRYDLPYEKQTAPHQPDPLGPDANLEVFPPDRPGPGISGSTSRGSPSCKRPACEAALAEGRARGRPLDLAARGIRHVTSFAVDVDAGMTVRQALANRDSSASTGRSLRRFVPRS